MKGHNHLLVRPIPLAPDVTPWIAALFPYAAIPLPEEQKQPLRQWLEGISAAISSDASINMHVFLQTWKIAAEGAASIYEQNIAKWLPAIGLGVWPFREPPRRLTQEAVMDCAASMFLEEEPVLSANFLSHVSAGSSAATHALQHSAGSGMPLVLCTNDDFATLANNTKQAFLATIQDSAYRNHRFYVPLLEGSTLGSAKKEQLDLWMCGAHTYLRESAEDGGLLFLSRSPSMLALLYKAMRNLDTTFSNNKSSTAI